jgi:hypothetical protein
VFMRSADWYSKGFPDKKSKITRDRDHDVSEKIVLGMINTTAGTGEVVYDQRPFNQDKGMKSGFATDDQYNIYDKGLFTAHNTLSTFHKPKKDADNEMYGGADGQLEKVLKTDPFRADKGFVAATERGGPRNRPVGDTEEVKTGLVWKFLAMDKIGDQKKLSGFSENRIWFGSVNRAKNLKANIILILACDLFRRMEKKTKPIKKSRDPIQCRRKNTTQNVPHFSLHLWRWVIY